MDEVLWMCHIVFYFFFIVDVQLMGFFSPLIQGANEFDQIGETLLLFIVA